ncbi:MAG: response regulator [Thermodesulfobacteriota bacterium]
MDNRSILIIDDDPAVCAAYREVLSAEQGAAAALRDTISQLLEMRPSTLSEEELPRFELLFASQGQDGFALAETARREGRPFALAFIDIRMPPGWDGMETARRIRQIDPHIELVMVTAYSDRSRAEIVKAVGSPDKLLFLRKPFHPDELRQIALSQTEKWNLSRRHERQRRELAAVLAAAPAAIVTLEASDATVRSWNQAAEKTTGYPAAAVIGTPCPLDLDIHGPVHAEIVIRDASGRQRVLSRNLAPIDDEQGQGRHLVVSFWDISAIRVAEAALKESEARFRALVETTSDWVWEIDAAGVVRYSSPVGKKLLGYRPDELVGRNFFDVLLPDEFADHFKNRFAQCVAEKCSFQAVERPTRRKDGQLIIIESSGVPIIDGSDAIQGFRGIDRDITRRKEDEEKHRQLEEQFRQSQRLESLGTLAGGIAHDFNNILTPILSGAQVCLLEMDPENGLYDTVKSIRDSAQRATELVRQILSFSRSRQAAAPHPLNCNQVIRDFSNLLRRVIREDISLEFDLDEALWNIFGNPGQLEQVLLNLAVNARDAIAGRGRITIRTRNARLSGTQQRDFRGRAIVGEYAVLSVLDNGMGMTPETLSRAFEPFYTTKEVGAGTGLGLSTVCGIVELHGGRIVVESSPQKGTAFHLYFKKTPHQNLPDQEPSSGSVKGGSETILLVEDDTDVRVSIASALRHYGYQVIGAANGSEAMKIFDKSSLVIDLLLTDIIMPDMNGRELAQLLRDKDPLLPVVYMSGHPLDMITDKLTDIDPVLFIPKPFSAEDIARTVRQTLDRGTSQNLFWGDMKP